MAGGPFLRPSTVSITRSTKDQNRDETSEQGVRYPEHSHHIVYATDCSNPFICCEANEDEHDEQF